MSESGHMSQQWGGAEDRAAQIKKHLADKPSDEILDEFETELDTMTDLSYDKDKIDAYLAALDEKDPLEEDLDINQSWLQFSERHAILFEQENEPEERKPRNTPRRRPVLSRLLIAAVIAVLASLLCAQAAGFDVFGVIGRWTHQNFKFERDNAAGEAAPPAASQTSYTSYATLQEAMDAYGVQEALAPSWIPERYKAQYIEATPFVERTMFNASYSEGTSELMFSYIYWTEKQYESSVLEKDGMSVILYEREGITHYIMSNEDVVAATWMNGNCECIIAGNVTREELERMIDSIYV